MFFNSIGNAKDISSASSRLLDILSLYRRDFEIKKKRNIKAKQGCPLKGYCPYYITEPFDCNSCPQK